MANCPNFKQTRVTGPVMHPLEGPPTQSVSDLNWCSHKHSPVSEEAVRKFLGWDKKLKCGGDLSRCQVPAHLR